MISLVFIVLFFLCLGMATVSVLLGYQFIQNYNTSFHKNYFYYLISFYAFALYGIWGQIIITQLLKQIETSVRSIEFIANFLPILGVPFLFVTWIMLISMAYSLLEKQLPKPWKFVHIFLFVCMVSSAWFGYNFLHQHQIDYQGFQKYFGITLISVFEFSYYLVFVIIIQFSNHGNKLIDKHILIRFALLMLLFMMIRMALIPFSFMSSWYLAIALIIYFVSNFFPLMYLRMHTDRIFIPVRAEHPSNEKIEQIYRKYKITKREREIVQQICLGKTNQQIADELFISLQTVKDHTHRIYSKIGIRSRMQLVKMVN